MAWAYVLSNPDPEGHEHDCLVRQHFGMVCTCGKVAERNELDERLMDIDDPSELTDREYARWLILRDVETQELER